MDAPVGAVFTPLSLARWAAAESGLLDLWLGGGTILDPTCGSGNLLLALALEARSRGVEPDASQVSRLYGMEARREFLEALDRAWKAEDLPPLPRENLRQGDFVLQTCPESGGENWGSFDGVFANPPWITFAALPEKEKELYRPHFLTSGLVKNRRNALWGSSRVDLAALVWIKIWQHWLKPGGLLGIFAPLSLVLNTGAHGEFRREIRQQARWKGVWDWGKKPPFPQVSTRCGFFALSKSSPESAPVPYHIPGVQGPWTALRAEPWPQEDSPWRVTGSESSGDSLRPGQGTVLLPPGCRCRQGVNTSGANQAYLVDAIPPDGPLELFFPLAEAPGTATIRYLFLPHDPTTGKPLDPRTFREKMDTPWGRGWMDRWEQKLRDRKGPMVKLWRDRGCWWSLVGVGPYTFSPWKIVWKAFGSGSFQPFPAGPRDSKPQIPFQALQVYLSFGTEEEAEAALKAIRLLPVDRMLRESRILGGKSGAQPGRMRPFFIYS